MTSIIHTLPTEARSANLACSSCLILVLLAIDDSFCFHHFLRKQHGVFFDFLQTFLQTPQGGKTWGREFSLPPSQQTYSMEILLNKTFRSE